MNVEWLPIAEADMHAIIDHVAEHDPAAALRLAERLVLAVGRLSEQPFMGREGRVPGTRELIVANTDYIVPYIVEQDTVVIVRVLHRARRWPTRF